MMNTLFQIVFSKTKFFLFVYVLFLLLTGWVLLEYNRKDSVIFINRFWTSGQDLFFKYITHLGDGFVAVIVVVYLFIKNKKQGIVALSAFAFTAGITQFLKHVVFDDAMRPYIELWREFKLKELHLVLPEELMKKGNSFPSGHTTSAFSIFIILTLFSKKPIYGLAFGFLAVLASYSRVYLSQHFFEDIFVGSFIGVFGSLFIYLMYLWKSPKGLL